MQKSCLWFNSGRCTRDNRCEPLNDAYLRRFFQFSENFPPQIRSFSIFAAQKINHYYFVKFSSMLYEIHKNYPIYRKVLMNCVLNGVLVLVTDWETTNVSVCLARFLTFVNNEVNWWILIGWVNQTNILIFLTVFRFGNANGGSGGY